MPELAVGPVEQAVMEECDEIDRKAHLLVLTGETVEIWDDADLSWLVEAMEWRN